MHIVKYIAFSVVYVQLMDVVVVAFIVPQIRKTYGKNQKRANIHTRGHASSRIT